VKKWLEWPQLRILDKKRMALVIVMLLALLFVFRGEENSMTQMEKRIAQTLSQTAGAGRVQVSIYYDQTSSAFGGGGNVPLGALAVCEGAGDIAVRIRLTEALKTLLGLEASQVMVLEMEVD